MTCLKCGRETDQTFCESCREVMQRYPVKPGTIVILPKDRSAAYRRTARRQTVLTAEEQVEGQKKVIRRLHRVIFLLILLLAAAGAGIGYLVKSPHERPLGQNYSTVAKPTEESTTETTTEAIVDVTEPSST